MNDCLFCQLKKEDVLIDHPLFFVILDRFPVTEGHTLIIPKRHIKMYFLMTEEENRALFELIKMCKDHLDDIYHPDGYNIGINNGASAGQTIFHLHIHLIPRYKGDMNDPKGGVRGVIPSKQKYELE